MKHPVKPLLLLCFTAACGEASGGADEATLCVVDAAESRPPGAYRIMAAAYRFDQGIWDGTTEVIHDAPLVGGRGCLRLRPPSDRFRAGSRREDNHARLRIDATGVQIQLDAWPIDVVLYEDLNDSGRFEAGDGVLDRLSRSGGLLPFWLADLAGVMRRHDEYDFDKLLALLAPGHRPFVLAVDRSYIYQAPGNWEIEPIEPVAGSLGAGARPWTELHLGAPTPEPPGCEDGLFYPQCLYVDNARGGGDLEILVDPRVPPDYTRWPASDPFAPRGGGVEAEFCVRYDRYLVVYQTAEASVAEPSACTCRYQLWEYLVITLAADPPPWLRCQETVDGEADDVDLWLDVEAIEADHSWWDLDP